MNARRVSAFGYAIAGLGIIDGIVEGDCAGETVAAVHDAVAGGAGGGHVEMIAEMRKGLIDDAVQVFHHLGLQRHVECLRSPV
ncbi:hypothetical protein J3O30_18330 [Rhizobium sp. NZLR1]|nr:hypothetical protein J3O30_18330 [Rhizobium sp. NZLR1]